VSDFVERAELLAWLDAKRTEYCKEKLNARAKILSDVYQHVLWTQGVELIQDSDTTAHPAQYTELRDTRTPGWNIPLMACARCGTQISIQGYSRKKDKYCRGCGRRIKYDE